MAQPPITPSKQLIPPQFGTLLDSPDYEKIDCSPETKIPLKVLKRKASEILEGESPKKTGPFLKWRLRIIQADLEVLQKVEQGILEARTFFDDIGHSRADVLKQLRAEKRTLLDEKAQILGGGKAFEADLNDTASFHRPVIEAYITELRMVLADASSSKQRLPGMEAPTLQRGAFKKAVTEYLGTTTGSTYTMFCNVLGFSLPSNVMKCAHIIPHSWNNKDLGHIFGTSEPPLTSKRNGLCLQTKSEEGFDNCWLAIVPADTVESVPTEWKIVLLNTEIKNKQFFNDELKWGDIDGRRLTFLNDNRPARRFLYMRYALAWLHADQAQWPQFREKVPPGTVWATPSKPDGYLRKSILLELGRRTGDKLPQSLIDSGVFEDPASSSPTADEIAGIRVINDFKDHLDGKRDAVEDPDEDMDEPEGERHV